MVATAQGYLDDAKLPFVGVQDFFLVIIPGVNKYKQTWKRQREHGI
jgi:hypothetical protein